MTRLLKPKHQHKPKQGRAENPVNGSDAESFALAKVVLACRGEGQWGSREEDNSKIDLILSTDHPWHNGERMLLLGQVKSGGSYGVRHAGGFTLKAAAKKAAIRTSQSICVVWVDRDADSLFWAYIHPNSTTTAQVYGHHHQVSPAMLFDLARCSSKTGLGPVGGRGLTISPRQKHFAQRRKQALQTYRTTKQICSPSLGAIELTRLGWRHMFRRSRAAKNKSASIDLIPLLHILLEHHPSTSSVTSTSFNTAKDFEYRTCEHLLKFEELKLFDDQTKETQAVTAYVRVLEEIRYPCNWADRAMLSQSVARRVVLKSAYYK